jgi:hypothetical protein
MCAVFRSHYQSIVIIITPTTIVYPPAKTKGFPEESDQSAQARETAWK